MKEKGKIIHASSSGDKTTIMVEIQGLPHIPINSTVEIEVEGVK